MSCRRITVTGVTLTVGTSLVLNISPRDFGSRCNYEMPIDLDLSNTDGTEEVQLNDGTTTYPLLDCIAAEPFHTGDIPQNECHRARGVFRMTYGATEDPHFLVKHPAPKCCTTIIPTAGA